MKQLRLADLPPAVQEAYQASLKQPQRKHHPGWQEENRPYLEITVNYPRLLLDSAN